MKPHLGFYPHIVEKITASVYRKKTKNGCVIGMTVLLSSKHQEKTRGKN